ncbi:heterokaryon incompatibility protein-domain-containing protein [Aspergillus carlsbadensis]|nr:heterokaryon incompatibility protein-domain-containing protein [Aspergillus carlsbadensis]
MPESLSYVALSYCWGGLKFFNTTKENIHSLKRGFSVSILEQTLQDAIQVARDLDMRYIWIDGLCIIQNDTLDWEREVTMMADVYNNTEVTIAAFSAVNVKEGFLHPRTPVPFTQHWTDESGSTTSLAARPRVVTGLHALDHNPFGPGNPFLDPVQRRGWCFQEEILSRRLIIYSTNEIQWLCRSETRCECSRLDAGNTTSTPFTSYLSQLRQDPFGFWAEKFPEYTERAFTCWRDRLPAISGIASTIRSLTSSNYVAGIWLNDFTRSLSWTASPADIKPCSPMYTAPSFSWTSINSPIYEFDDRYSSPEHAMLTLRDWKLEPKGIDPLGEVRHASLTVSGFVHHATITYDEDLWRDTFRVDIANRTAEFHQDTDLEKCAAKSLCGTKNAWSVRRSKNKMPAKHEWEGGVSVLAICLFRDPAWATAFLILGPSSVDSDKLERIGIAEFLHSEHRWGQLDASDDWMTEIIDPRYLRTTTIV